MHRRKALGLLAAVPIANAVSPALLGGIPSKKAVYQGGTLAELRVSAQGTVSTIDPDWFVFKYKGGSLRIEYERIDLLEYGQRAGRRLGLGIVVSPLFLLSKKRRHYLTISFHDENGRQQAAVFELGKRVVRTILAGIEARTGRRIEYLDEEARKASER